MGQNERNQVQDPRATITPMFLQKRPSLHCDFPSQDRSKELRDIKQEINHKLLKRKYKICIFYNLN